ncbi:MAG: OmpA family protein [Bacteroidota bacterium]
MKRLLSTLLLSLLVSPMLAQVLQFDFDKPADDQLKDVSMHHHEVNTYGGLQYTADRFGIDCRAALFTGNQIVEVLDNDQFNFEDEFTAMAWMVLPDSLDFQWITLVCKGLDADEHHNSPAFRVQMTSQTVSVNTSSTKEIDEVPQKYPTERWFHFATTFEDGRITLYVDGKRYKYFNTSTQLGKNNHSVTIGYDVPGSTEFFSGAMDDFYLFPSAFSEAEIKKYMNDDRNKKLTSACPVNPQKSPPLIASSDPWDGIELDDFDLDDPTVSGSIDPSPGLDPWATIDIDELEETDPVDSVTTSNIPPVDPAAADPIPDLATNDPWGNVAIDDFDPTATPTLPDTISNLPEQPLGVDSDNLQPLVPSDQEATDEPDDAETPTTLLPPRQPAEGIPDSRLNPVPPDGDTAIDSPDEEEPTTTPVKRDRLTIDLPAKSGLPQSAKTIDLDPVKIVPMTDNENDENTEEPDTSPEADMPEANTETPSEPQLVFNLDSLAVGRKMILDKIEFARHSHHLNDRSKQVLTELAEVLKKNPDYSILLEGHTETKGNYEANMTLSRKRAEACKRYLIKKRKIKPSRIETKHYGPEKPLTAKADVKWKNRRVEVTVF